jgi:hypothetical protein
MLMFTVWAPMLTRATTSSGSASWFFAKEFATAKAATSTTCGVRPASLSTAT